MSKITLKYIFITLLSMSIAMPILTAQILPSSASYHQAADVKNKQIPYKEIRKRKHSKNKPNLKNQTLTSCQILVVRKTETLPSARNNISAVWNPVNNKAYIFGGYDVDYLNQIIEYNPATNTVTVKPETLPSARQATSAVWNPVNNKAYIFGGTSATGYFNQIIEYDPATGTVTTKSETLPSTRYGGSVVWNPVNNKAYIFGGYDTDYLNQIIEYDPVTGIVTTKAETLPSKRYLTSAVWSPVNNKAYIFGGYDGSSRLNQIVEYDPATGTVTTKSETLPSVRYATSAVWNSTNNRAYIFGGNDGSYLNQIIEYNPATSTVTVKLETLPSRVQTHSAACNPTNNKTYIFGGYDGSSRLNQIVEHTPCLSPSNPSISSATLNGSSIPTTASSYRITAGQTLIANASATDAYPGNRVTISCNPPAGMYTPSPAYIGTGRLEFTPTAADVGNTYSYIFNATSDSGAAAASTVSFTVSVDCSPPDNGCINGNICVRNACCTRCTFVTGICASDPSCVFTAPSQPLISSPINSSPIPTPIPPPVATSTASPTQTATPPPVQNTTNSGSTNSSHGPNVSPPPQINSAPPSTAANTPRPSGFISVSEGTVKEAPSTPKPTSIDFSKPELYGVKPDSANTYIDLSKGEVKSRK